MFGRWSRRFLHTLLMAYALNLDPTKNQSASLPKPIVAGNLLSMSFYGRNTDVTYTVQTRADMQNWSTSGVTVSAPDINGICTATVETTDPGRFMSIVIGH